MNSRRSMKYLIPSTAILLLMIPFVAISRPHRPALLPDGGVNFGCGTCHVNPAGGGARNSFGQDWEGIAIPAGDIYVAALASRDSDDDGFTNEEEFDAKTHPGDSNSKPEPQPVNPKGRQYTRWGKIKSGIK